MQFIYHKNAGESQIVLDKEAYHYLFRVRHKKKSESLTLRNLTDENAYIYEIVEVSKRGAILSLKKTEKTSANTPRGHLIWAMIEPKCIEKTLPFLNELNLLNLTFFYADFSQKQFQLDLERIARILENSCQQCGRITRLNLEILPNINEVLQKYPKISVMDFNSGESKLDLEIPVLVGPEGGFSPNERAILQHKPHFSPPYCNILRSETAAIYAASRIL